MINVLHILSDGNIGGAGYYVVNFVKNYDKERFSVKVALPRGAALKKPLSAAGADIIEVDFPRDKSFTIKAVRALKKVIKEQRPDIVHTHGSLSGRLAARFAGKNKIVFTKHTLSHVPKGFDKRIVSAISNATCDIAIACSEAARKNLVDCGTSAKKVRVVYNGCGEIPAVSPEEKKALREKYSIKEDAFVFSIVARLAPIKSIDTFIDAAFFAAIEDARYVVAGGGELMDSLTGLVAENDMSDSFVFTGQLADAQEIFQLSDAFVISSRMENMPLSLIEAMSCSLPIVATSVGGIKEMLADGENALLCSAGDEEEMSLLFRRIRNDPELRRKLGAGAQAAYEQKFSVQGWIENTQNIYTNLISKKEKKNERKR